MEPILKIWYDNLKEGKVLGLRCKDCGAVEFPPVPVCNSCGKHDMEWVEMSGDVTIDTLGYSAFGVPPYSMSPVINGYGRTKEGNIFCATVLGYTTTAEMDALTEKLPLQATLEPSKMSEEIYFPNFRLKE